MRPQQRLLARQKDVRPLGIGRRALIKNAAGRLLIAIALLPGLQVVNTQAQTTTTYVSGKGKDGGSCSANAPCKTLQAALDKTLLAGKSTLSVQPTMATSRSQGQSAFSLLRVSASTVTGNSTGWSVANGGHLTLPSG